MYYASVNETTSVFETAVMYFLIAVWILFTVITLRDVKTVRTTRIQKSLIFYIMFYIIHFYSILLFVIAKNYFL